MIGTKHFGWYRAVQKHFWASEERTLVWGKSIGSEHAVQMALYTSCIIKSWSTALTDQTTEDWKHIHCCEKLRCFRISIKFIPWVVWIKVVYCRLPRPTSSWRPFCAVKAPSPLKEFEIVLHFFKKRSASRSLEADMRKSRGLIIHYYQRLLHKGDVVVFLQNSNVTTADRTAKLLNFIWCFPAKRKPASSSGMNLLPFMVTIVRL